MLYGRELANLVPANCTLEQGAEVCGLLRDNLMAAINAMDGGLLNAADQVLESENRTELRGQLEDAWSEIAALETMINEQAAGDFSKPMPADYVQSLQSKLERHSKLLKLASEWYSLPSLSGMSDGIAAAFGGVAGMIASAASKVLGSTLGALWWVLLGLGLVLWLVLRSPAGVAAAKVAASKATA